MLDESIYTKVIRYFVGALNRRDKVYSPLLRVSPSVPTSGSFTVLTWVSDPEGRGRTTRSPFPSWDRRYTTRPEGS